MPRKQISELPIIRIGDKEVQLNDDQKKYLIGKINILGIDSMEVKADIILIDDYNKRQKYFDEKRKQIESVSIGDSVKSKSIEISFSEPVVTPKVDVSKIESTDGITGAMGIQESFMGNFDEQTLISTIKSLNLDKPIVFFDIESTGLDIAVDKIVSISATKVMPDGSMTTKSTYVNPVIPISKEASDIHGITNEMLVNKPKFAQVAKSLYEFMKDCYIGGYNNNYFDNTMLQEEFLRCGIDFPPRDIVSIDACAIFKHFEKRDLSAALKFYCGKQMENAHDASADTKATLQIFFAQINRYSELKGKSIKEISLIGRNENNVDFQGRIIKDADGDYVWNFGKPKGRKIKLELGFGDWVLSNNFPLSFKKLVTDIMKEINEVNV